MLVLSYSFLIMESSVTEKAQGAPKYSCSKSDYPLRNRRTARFLQGTFMFIILTTHFRWVASERDETLTWFQDERPWNKSLYKVKRECLDFHAPNAPSLYYYWPEADPLFDHCCGLFLLGSKEKPPKDILVANNFTYGVYGPQLIYFKYNDLGLVDSCLPFWKCGRFFDRIEQTHTYYLFCEFHDLEGLYSRRFWNGTVFKYGLLQSALPYILSLEILVLLSASLYCLCRRQVFRSMSVIKVLGRTWFEAVNKTVLIVWVHLCLLVIIGNGLTEAMGHQYIYDPASKSFYNYAQLYIVLSVLLWYSSFLQQLSYWIALVEDYEKLPVADKSTHPRSDALSLERRQTPSQSLEKLEKRIGLTADWKWQPIAAQVGILFCLWGFLTYIDDNNLMASGFFGIVVQAAAPWSGLYASKIIIHTFPFLTRSIFNTMKSPRQVHAPWTWRTVAGLKRWQGRANHGGRPERDHAQNEDSAAPLVGELEIGKVERANTP
ncbi:hypothetical protein M758_9G118800 [Ceratodon purpureus]|nr:hypothetical protein M758_9G118800 [Ceratodon purpureus]